MKKGIISPPVFFYLHYIDHYCCIVSIVFTTTRRLTRSLIYTRASLTTVATKQPAKDFIITILTYIVIVIASGSTPTTMLLSMCGGVVPFLKFVVTHQTIRHYFFIFISSSSIQAIHSDCLPSLLRFSFNAYPS